MGTSSGTRVVACSSRSETGSGRSGGGANAEWLSRGTLARASFPFALLSASLRWGSAWGIGLSASRIPSSIAIVGHLPGRVAAQSFRARGYAGSGRPAARMTFDPFPGPRWGRQ